MREVRGHAGFGTVGAPPEPFAACFVKWTPQHGDAFFLEREQGIGNHFHVAHKGLVFVTFRFPLAGGGVVSETDAEFRVRVVAAGLRVEGFYSVHRVFPMPVKLRNAALLPYSLCHFQRCMRVALVPLFAGILAGGMQEIETDEYHVLAARLVDIAEFGLGVKILRGVLPVVFEGAFGHHAADRALAEIAVKKVVKLLGAFGGLRSDGLGADVPGGRLVFRNFDVVNGHPSPGMDNPDCVFTFF